MERTGLKPEEREAVKEWAGDERWVKREAWKADEAYMASCVSVHGRVLPAWPDDLPGALHPGFVFELPALPQIWLGLPLGRPGSSFA